jgi:hypothetical protein
MTLEDVAWRRTALVVRGPDTEAVRAGISAIVYARRPGLRSVISGTKNFDELRPI